MATLSRSEELQRKKEELQRLIQERNERKKKLQEFDDVTVDEEFLSSTNIKLDSFIREFSEKHNISIGNDESGRTVIDAAELRKRMAGLSISLIPLTNFPGRERIIYTKYVQTDVAVDSESTTSEPQEPILRDDNTFEVPVTDEGPVDKFLTYKLDEDEQYEIMKSSRFGAFFDRAAFLIERALDLQTDVCHDYRKEDFDLPTGDEARTLDMVRRFHSSRHSKNRTIAALDWSIIHPELLLASYMPNELGFSSSDRSVLSSVDPDGLVSVWNVRFSSEQTKPEYSFHFQSPITSAQFLPYHSNLILGGTFSGRIVMWDNRIGRLMPVQRSNTSTNTHTYPIFCTKVVGTQNAHNIVSVSSDGRMCTWSLDMLTQPTETLDLNHKKSRCISASCLSFLADEISHCVIGSEEGTLYMVQRLGNMTGISDVFDAHNGPVSSVHCHPGIPSNKVDFKHLCLSSSMDWSLKLWSTKNNQPLHCFDCYSECVCDVAWSPVSVSTFACINANGLLDIWNINKSLESPYISVPAKSEFCYTKLAWSPQGNFIAVGNDCGELHIYSSDNTERNEHEEVSQMKKVVEDLKNHVVSRKSRSSRVARSSILAQLE